MASMNEMSDRELDDLFRKAAEEIEVPFDPEAWKRMEQKLDDGGERNGWLRWSLLAGLLLLIGTGIYLLQQRQAGLSLSKHTILAGGNAKVSGNADRKPSPEPHKTNEYPESNVYRRGSSLESRTAENKALKNAPVAENGGNVAARLNADDKKTQSPPDRRNPSEKPGSQTKVTQANDQSVMGTDETAETVKRKNLLDLFPK